MTHLKVEGIWQCCGSCISHYRLCANHRRCNQLMQRPPSSVEAPIETKKCNVKQTTQAAKIDGPHMLDVIPYTKVSKR